MMLMRGQIEEQAHQIRQLKQQRLDDYVAFDQRISNLQSAAASPAAKTPANANSVSSDAFNNEQGDYKAAFELVRQNQPTQAKQAFASFIGSYPTSKLLPNSYYWLGRLQAQSSEHKQAIDSLNKLIQNYPDDKRAPDATLYMAKSQFELGDKQLAQVELESLIDRYSHSNSKDLQRVVRQAREFMQSHYP